VAGTTQRAKVDCTSNHNTTTGVQAQNFIGAMAYERLWFNHDQYALSFGGGWISNSGGYRVPLPPALRVHWCTSRTGRCGNRISEKARNGSYSL